MVRRPVWCMEANVRESPGRDAKEAYPFPLCAVSGALRQNWGMFAVRNLLVPGLPPLSFEAPPGGVLAVSGPSGSGKTRLLRALADLDPHGGEVAWRGRTARSMPAPQWRRLVGLLPAEPRFWSATVAGHFPAGAASLDEALLSLRLSPELLDADPSRLSTGERARLALLRLFARSPEVLLLDEPTANLDPASRDLVIRRIGRYREERRAAVLWVSHAPGEVGAADRALLLPEGRVRAMPGEGPR